MENYKLNTNISKEDLNKISSAQEKVILVKHAEKKSSPPVSWVSFEPRKNNTIEWENNFAIYASNTVDEKYNIEKTTYKAKQLHPNDKQD